MSLDVKCFLSNFPQLDHVRELIGFRGGSLCICIHTSLTHSHMPACLIQMLLLC